MSGANRIIGAGSTYNFWGRLDTQARMTGKNGSAPTAGTGEGMQRLTGVKTLPAGVVESEAVDITGDDTVLGQINFAPNELPEFVGEYAVDNLELAAIFQGTSVETLGDLRFGALQPNNPVNPDGFMIVQGKAKSQDTATRGTSQWTGIIVPLTTAEPLGRDSFEERSPGNYRVKFSPQIASKKPYGVTISSTDLGTDGLLYIPFTADNPVTMHRIEGNSSQQDFVLDYEPITAAKTLVWYANGALQATSAYTITPATKTISFTSAPTGATWVLYEFRG